MCEVRQSGAVGVRSHHPGGKRRQQPGAERRTALRDLQPAEIRFDSVRGRKGSVIPAALCFRGADAPSEQVSPRA